MNRLDERYNKLDKIVSATYANVFSFSKNSDIILKDFDYNSEICKVFLEVANMVGYMNGKKIYLNTSLFHFIKAKIAKKNKYLKWIPKHKRVRDGIDVYKVAAHEAVAFEEDEKVFAEIYKAYYERKKK